jgi:hypothetical protein
VCLVSEPLCLYLVTKVRRRAGSLALLKTVIASVILFIPLSISEILDGGFELVKTIGCSESIALRLGCRYLENVVADVCSISKEDSASRPVDARELRRCCDSMRRTKNALNCVIALAQDVLIH